VGAAAPLSALGEKRLLIALLLFPGRGNDPWAIGHAALAFAAFGVLASVIYCWNGVADRVADRAHPVKRCCARMGRRSRSTPPRWRPLA
jgi:4-hydroxybenzoate polyprenyltransferase